MKTLILLILDGWGHSNKYHGNAIKQAYTPNMDFLLHHYPNTLLHASGKQVGLPEKQMGNSEVGHTIIGAGRTINQELVRISNSIKSKVFFKNKTILKNYEQVKATKNKMHLIGLCSDGGVHSHIEHLCALINMSKKYKDILTCIHIIADGRDTKPQNVQAFVNRIQNHISDSPHIKICTISGRYYSMDRDCRWSRTETAYKCLINNNINSKYFNNINLCIIDNYQKKIYDEFILPTRINYGKIDEGDGIIFFNFRPDRMRQLVQSFAMKEFKNFSVKTFNNLHITTFTNYDTSLNLPIIFPKIANTHFLGQMISENGLKQFRLAETEKYAHVTYFFNGGREEPFPGEDRQLIPSPSVDFYDSTPDMSAKDITKQILYALDQKLYHVIIANYANADMIGHTGNFLATKKSIEIVDTCLGQLLKHAENHNINILITADHGNAEVMIDEYDEPCKSHTNNLVPFVFIPNQIKNFPKDSKNVLLSEGSLSDIAPTILDLLHLTIPKYMNGKSLLNKNQQNQRLARPLTNLLYNK